MESVSFLLKKLEKEESELQEKHDSLSLTVETEESQLGTCVTVLEEQYQKHQSDLETSIATHQQELKDLKAALESARLYRYTE